MRLLTKVFAVFVVLAALPIVARTHCQVPCGIYDDALRVKAMLEDVATIEKATGEIVKLAAKRTKSADDENQLIRWVNTKEEHAKRIQHVTLDYFLAQRIKPAEEGDAAGHDRYVDHLVVLHAIVIDAMKVRQKADLKRVEKLKDDVIRFSILYMQVDEEGEEKK